MSALQNGWASFLAFMSNFFRMFARNRSPKLAKFSYDYPSGTKPPRIDRGHVTPTGACRIMGNRWWRRQMYLRGRRKGQ